MSTSSLSGPSDNSAYPQYIQDNANKLGITAQQYQNLADSLPNSGAVAQTAQGQSWNVQGGQTAFNTEDTFNRVSQFVRANNALGGNKQQTGPTQPTTVAQNPMYDITNLGAAALGEQAVYNPEPGKADPKSGIGTVTQPQMTTNKATAPTGPWSTTPGTFTKATALSPSATTALTPTAQANAAQMPTTQTPAASFGVTPAPAAPGVSVAPAPLTSAPGAPGPQLPQGPPLPPGVQQAMGQMPGYIQQAVQQATAQMPAAQPPTGVPPGIARGSLGINRPSANVANANVALTPGPGPQKRA